MKSNQNNLSYKELLIAESCPEIAESLSHYFKQCGFHTTVVHDGDAVIKKALNQPFDALILDLQLEKPNGYEIIQTIRTWSKLPIIALTAQQDEIDRWVAFELGVDDYFQRPCHFEDIYIKLNAIIQRNNSREKPKPVIQHQAIHIDCIKHEVSLHNKPLELTNAEFNILEMLIKSPGKAFSKEELTEQALGRKYTNFDRSIDVHISNLRNKLGKNQHGEHWLKTVRGFGYAFNADSPKETENEIKHEIN